VVVHGGTLLFLGVFCPLGIASLDTFDRKTVGAQTLVVCGQAGVESLAVFAALLFLNIVHV
jgi:hypothetical protein